jgi:hypothetical protein
VGNEEADRMEVQKTLSEDILDKVEATSKEAVTESEVSGDNQREELTKVGDVIEKVNSQPPN